MSLVWDFKIIDHQKITEKDKPPQTFAWECFNIFFEFAGDKHSMIANVDGYVWSEIQSKYPNNYDEVIRTLILNDLELSLMNHNIKDLKKRTPSLTIISRKAQGEPSKLLGIRKHL